jgi:hypothetical protein
MGFVGTPHPSILFLAILKEAMQIREMNRIDVSLVGLEIVALMKNLRHVEMIRISFEKFIVRHQRRLPRPHIGENDSTCFLARISKMTNGIATLAAARLARLFETASVNII